MHCPTPVPFLILSLPHSPPPPPPLFLSLEPTKQFAYEEEEKTQREREIIMNNLDSPLDGFLFINTEVKSLNFLLNSVWTWVAVLTAAVSFWRFSRLSATVNNHSIKSKCNQSHQISASPPSLDRDTPAESGIPSTASTNGSLRGLVLASSPIDHQTSEDPAVTNCKGKFFAAFEGNRESGDEMEVAEREDAECGGAVDAVVEGWRTEEEEQLVAEAETVLRVRMRDMGWYRCQDLSVFDGRVVKLWEDSRSPTPSPRRRCSSPRSVVRCGW